MPVCDFCYCVLIVNVVLLSRHNSGSLPRSCLRMEKAESRSSVSSFLDIKFHQRFVMAQAA